MQRTFDRVLLLRHIGLSAGAVMAFVQYSRLGIGAIVLVLVGASAVLNLLLSLLSRRPGLAEACRVASPVIGVGSWTALITLTGGVVSPFISGLWLEILLSFMLFTPSGIAMVGLASVAALLGQQVWQGFEGLVGLAVVQGGFLAAMTGLAFALARQGSERHQKLEGEREKLDHRLRALEEQIEGERALGQVGENTARLAHGLKNAVHSLRGFTSLIEPAGDDGEARDQAALRGLLTAIDDLEKLARLTLEKGEDDAPSPDPDTCEPQSVISRALRELSLSSPGVHWTVRSVGSPRPAEIRQDDLQEVLLILMRNAIEAMQGEGEGSVELRFEADEVAIRVSDAGPGIRADQVTEIFRAGYTTKSEGSGYGLFLARRVLTRWRGILRVRPSEGRGASFEFALPLSGAGAQAARSEE
jgi:signal transduction histidine kinase